VLVVLAGLWLCDVVQTLIVVGLLARAHVLDQPFVLVLVLQDHFPANTILLAALVIYRLLELSHHQVSQIDFILALVCGALLIEDLVAASVHGALTRLTVLEDRVRQLPSAFFSHRAPLILQGAQPLQPRDRPHTVLPLLLHVLVQLDVSADALEVLVTVEDLLQHLLVLQHLLTQNQLIRLIYRQLLRVHCALDRHQLVVHPGVALHVRDR